MKSSSVPVIISNQARPFLYQVLGTRGDLESAPSRCGLQKMIDDVLSAVIIDRQMSRRLGRRIKSLSRNILVLPAAVYEP